MYRIIKALNHNGVIAFCQEDKTEYVILGKGIGFGKKVSETFQPEGDYTLYTLAETSDRGDLAALSRRIDPVYLEIVNNLLNQAEQTFGQVNRSILFVIADHLVYAVERIRKGEQMANPLTPDIKTLFYSEYRVAATLGPELKERLGVEITDDEIGYVALHIHSSIEDENVSVAMQMAAAVRECITLVEEITGRTIDVKTLAYNRLMNHVRYMVARAIKGETLKMSLNDYIELEFPDAFSIATTVCDHLSFNLHMHLEEVEIGYLAIHIERVLSDDLTP